MSILIKGMEMPKRCLDCPCFDLEYAECQVHVTATRENGCPLVEVPKPHGRLIDAEVVNSALKKRLLAVDTAPTVIEAEEQEHGICNME